MLNKRETGPLPDGEGARPPSEPGPKDQLTDKNLDERGLELISDDGDGVGPRDPDDPDGDDDVPEIPDPKDPIPDPHPDDPGEEPDLDPESPDLDPEADPEKGNPEEDDPLSPRAGVDLIFDRGGVSLGDEKDASSKKPRKKGAAPVPPGGRRGAVPGPALPAEASSDDDSHDVAPIVAATASDPEDGETFRPELDTFSGPFELLLYLIHKDEVDIFDIPIARILSQFLGRVRRLEATGRLDLQESGEYLVMAARLMEIKSRMLLPNDGDDDEDLLEAEVEDPRWSLVRQLLEYREIKERANLLEAAHRNRSQCFERIPGNLPPPEPGTLELKETSSLDLRAAFQRVLDLLRERDAVRVVPGEEIPIEVAMAGIRNQLFALPDRRRAFSEIFPAELGLRGLISYFMALLELTRLRHLRLEQPDDYGDILVILREAA